jgi:hypothetical protein
MLCASSYVVYAFVFSLKVVGHQKRSLLITVLTIQICSGSSWLVLFVTHVILLHYYALICKDKIVFNH